MSRLRKAFKKLTNKNTVLGKTVRSVLTPVTGGVRLVRAVAKGESITDAVREAGREKFFGVRVREVGAAIGAYYVGAAIAAKGATTTVGSVAGGTAASGGAAGGVAAGVATTSATGWASTIASIGKYSALGLALSRQFGIGPGAPQYGPETIPSENFLPNGLPGAIYPGYAESGFGGVDSFLPPPSESGAAGFFGTSTIAPFIMVGVILLLGIFIAFRR